MEAPHTRTHTRARTRTPTRRTFPHAQPHGNRPRSRTAAAASIEACGTAAVTLGRVKPRSHPSRSRSVTRFTRRSVPVVVSHAGRVQAAPSRAACRCSLRSVPRGGTLQVHTTCAGAARYRAVLVRYVERSCVSVPVRRCRATALRSGRRQAVKHPGLGRPAS
jgi:hypothetical protein